LDGIGEVTSLPDHAPHRNVDKVVLGAGSSTIRVAIVCPPTIYGRGRGPDNQRSVQVPELARVTIEANHGWQVGKGKARWGSVHIKDLSDLFLNLVERAAAGPMDRNLWNENGYYFASRGEIVRKLQQ